MNEFRILFDSLQKFLIQSNLILKGIKIQSFEII